MPTATDKAIFADTSGDPGLTVVTTFGSGSILPIGDPTVSTDDSSGSTLGIAPNNLVAGATQAGSGITLTNSGGKVTIAATGGGGGAPTTSKYILQTADGSLPNAQALSSLSTGLAKVITGTGVLSTAAAGTDYYAPAGSDSRPFTWPGIQFLF